MRPPWPRRRRAPLATEGQEADQAEARWAAILTSAPDAIVATSLDGTIVEWSTGAERAYGYRAAEAVGRHLSLVAFGDGRHELDALLGQAAAGRRATLPEARHRRRDGTAAVVALTVAPVLEADSSVTGALFVASDLTEQRRLDRSLEGALRALERAEAEAGELEARSHRFLADAAHQLRTPIAGIRACAETLLLGAPAPERDRLLADMVRETSRAARLITALLRMARLDQGEVLAPARCDLVALCRDEADRARALAPDLDIAVRTGDAGGEDRPELDADAVREVLANLLDNARRHATRCIELVVATGAAAVEVRVVDDGPGLPPAMAERAFERFVSLDGKGGSGLGLPIARGLARAHGGDLAYENGAFVLRLPARRGRDGDVAAGTP